MDDGNNQNDVNSLESPDTVTSYDSNTQNSEDSKEASVNQKPQKRVNATIQAWITRINIYLLLFILLVVLASGIVLISKQRNQNELEQIGIDSQQLTPEELETIRGTDTKVGDPRQTLTIESNSVFSGKVLIRDSLDVAGTINVGGPLTVPGINVSGESSFDQLTANQLSIAGDASIQGSLNIQRNLSVTGSATFGGPISAPQITISTLQINDDLSFGRHLDAGGPTPSRTNGSALGSGGTTSVSGTDTAGTVNINTGGSPNAGCFVTITFSKVFNGTPHVVITPVGSAASGVQYYLNARTTSGFSICSANTPPSGATFSFDYIAID